MKCTLICLIIVQIYMSTSKGARLPRQSDSFIFPDDDQPNGIPARFTSTTPVTRPTAGSSTTSTPRPPQSEEFLICWSKCPSTSEYNPVCGSDRQRYHNEQRLICANRCGAGLTILRRGNCMGL